MHRENDPVSPLKRHYFDARLHPWPLLRQYKFSTGEIALRRGK